MSQNSTHEIAVILYDHEFTNMEYAGVDLGLKHGEVFQVEHFDRAPTYRVFIRHDGRFFSWALNDDSVCDQSAIEFTIEYAIKFYEQLKSRSPERLDNIFPGIDRISESDKFPAELDFDIDVAFMVLVNNWFQNRNNDSEPYTPFDSYMTWLIASREKLFKQFLSDGGSLLTISEDVPIYGQENPYKSLHINGVVHRSLVMYTKNGSPIEIFVPVEQAGLLWILEPDVTQRQPFYQECPSENALIEH